MACDARMNPSDRPDTYWDGHGQGNQVSGTTRGLAAFPAAIVPEALPPLEEDEVEIVLIKMRTTTGDLASIRARKEGGVITYRMVDEYEGDYVLLSVQSKEPLTFSELTDMLWSSKLIDDQNIFLLEWNADPERNENDMDDLRHFFSFSSDYYAGLNDWYTDQFEEWAQTP